MILPWAYSGHCGLGPEIFRQKSQVSYSDHPTVPIHSFTRVTPIGGTGTSETISVGRSRRGCSPTLPESWKWLVTVLQFWTDEATVADGAVYGGRVRPASALAQYVMDAVNPRLEP